MLMMVEKGIRGAICHAIHWYAKQLISIGKVTTKTLTHYISCIQIKTICMDGQCIKNCLLMVLNIKKMMKKTSYDEDSNKGYIFEVDVKYPKKST